MDLEKLKKANDLSNIINQVEERLRYWESSKGVSSINIVYLNSSGGNNTQQLDNKYIEFEVLKTLTISAIKKHLAELKTEFNNL